VKAEAEIRRVIAELGRCIDARDFDGAAACYAQDAVLMLPGSAMLRGARAIRASLAAAFGADAPKVDVAVERVDVAGSDDLACAIGTGITHTTPPMRSKWAAMFRRHEGAWKITVDIHNADTVI
jgi:uncharacterized protein (TIGR02246 family)